MLGIVHLADSREQAIEDCTYGLQDFANYFGAARFVPLSNTVETETRSAREFVAEYAAGGNCCIGTPDDEIAYISGLLEQSGGSAPCCCSGMTGPTRKPRTDPMNCSRAR